LAPATEGLYVGGVFRINVGKDGLDRPVYACGLVRHDGTNWNSVGGDFFTNNHGGTYREDCYGEGLSLGVKALVRAGGNLFVGGSFLDQKNNYLNKFAMWNGQTWSTLGVKLGGDETVNAILISGGNIFIAGKFSDAGGNPNADYIAYYSSSTRRWNAVYPAAAKPTPTPTFRPPAPQPPSSRDTTRPQVTAYQAKGRAGAVMRFVYSVYDNSGVTREEIVVYRKAREIARISQGFSALPRTGVRRVRYSARGMKKGRMTYCVEAIDPSGNADRSCANLRLKKRRR